MSTVDRVILRHFPTGGLIGFHRALAHMGWRTSKLASKRPFLEWYADQKEVLATPHSKVSLLDGKYVVGGIILMPSLDAQVGPCLMAFHQFLMEPYRGSYRAWREAIRLAEYAARDLGYKWLVWTHRDEDTGRIYLKHKEV